MRLIKPSTIKLAREARRVQGFSLADFLHGYIYGHWVYEYISIGTGQHPLARLWSRLLRIFTQPRTKTPPNARIKSQDCAPTGTTADGYHGKVVPFEAVRQLVQVNENVRLQNLEKIIPYSRARDIILENPDHIVVLECPCRSARPDPCLPLDVCLIVGEPFASFVNEHHPARSRPISQSQAVEILQAEAERGHVHHAFFKDAMLGRFYAICNCCGCCCGALDAHRHGTPMLAPSGFTVRVDQALCLGCGACASLCQFEALSVDGYVALVDETACMGCGVCVTHCPQGALALERDPSKGEPLEIMDLIDNAALPS